MVKTLKIEILSFVSGFKELVYSLAEKLDFRVKEFKISLQGEMIEKEMDRAFMRLGEKALSDYQKNKNLLQLSADQYQNELEEIHLLKDKYSEILQSLSNLQRKAFKEALSQCTAQFNRTGWGLAQINIPDESKISNIKIKEIPLKQDILILMIKKGERMELVHGDTLLERGDSLICIGTEKGILDFKERLK
jgi:DNA gyrase/topoisomerase IV subunit A